MIIYFEDGKLLDHTCDFSLDAGNGYSHCRTMLWHIFKNFPFETTVYTNSLDAFSAGWCWDHDKNIPMIYIRDENKEWKLISEMTDRELRYAHNLERMYRNCEFCSVARIVSKKGERLLI